MLRFCIGFQRGALTILDQNIDFIGGINKSLADSLRNYQQRSSVGDSPLQGTDISFEEQLSNCLYSASGALSATGNFPLLSESSDIHSKFREKFMSGEIDPTSYQYCYRDVHEDMHFSAFKNLMFDKLNANPDLKISKVPIRRKNPTYLVILGVAFRKDLKKFLLETNAKRILLVESDIEYLYEFLSNYSIIELRDFVTNELNGELSISIGCGEPNDIIREITQWINAYNELGVEGALISNASYSTLKKSAIYNFLTTNQWYLENIMRFGYQVDEYNMIYNTASNFQSLSSRIFPKLDPNTSYLSKPVIITGSGPSLDDSIDFLHANRDEYLLVSGGSSISTLLESGLKPDIHVQLERSEHQFGLHEKLSQKFDLSDILLIASSTVPSGLQQLFKRCIYFFRPALSPLALYANNASEILNGEGPDTINAAVASLSALGFNNIGLVGVDCGSISKSSIRSKGAFGGYIPRKLDKVERGSSKRTVFTNSRLQSVRDVISWNLRVRKVKAINYSNGLLIKGSTYSTLDSFSDWISSSVNDRQTLEIDNSYVVDELWNNSIILNKYRLYTSWEVANPRQKTFEFCRKLEKIVESNDDIRLITKSIRDMISLSVKRSNQSSQLLPRITRGTLGKICPFITSLYNSSVSDDPNSEILPLIKEVLIEFIDLLESDLYSIFDAIEPVA
tara:strand:+ start:1271 stop:3310 length:2040 start_codon:yes stop_codon:yes gene_type:complete